MKLEWLIDMMKEWVIAQAYATITQVGSSIGLAIAYLMGQIVDLKTWVQNQNYLTTSFIDRGDPAAKDFTRADFTTDNAWHDRDLSAIVPANAKGVCMRVAIKADVINAYFYLKEKGNVIDANIVSRRTLVANVAHEMSAVCALDENRKIEYKAKNVTWQTMDITVKNWWF